ncbi:MAG: hypothetical protein AAFV45_08250 [Pseudomonadota bacterium]
MQRKLRRSKPEALASFIITSLMAGVLTVGILPVPDAAAKIKCNGAYQVIKGAGEIATPYCGDNYLARVARDFGVRVSAKTIRNNPNKKEEVCRLVGYDIRVQDICAGLRGDDGGRSGRN